MDENVPPEKEPESLEAPAPQETAADDPVPAADDAAATATDAPPADDVLPAGDVPSAVAAADDTQRAGRLRLIAGVGAIVVAAAVGVGLGTAMPDDDEDPPEIQPAAAEGQVKRSNVLSGTVADVGDSELTIDTASGDTEVAVDDDTTITDMTDINLDDLAVGDAVRITGEPSEDGAAVTAAQITTSDDEDLLAKAGVGPGVGGRPGDAAMPERPDLEDMPEPPNGEIPGEMERPPGDFDFRSVTGGTIESIDGDTITVTTEDGDTVTVTTSSATTVQRISEISSDDLEDGDEVTVFAADNDGTLTATAIRRGEDLFAGAERPRSDSDYDAGA